jgi:nitrous oxide reductase
MKKDTKPTLDRRTFLLASGATAGVAAAAATGHYQARKAVAAAEAATPSGYHVSAHIKKYYETTEI